MNVDQNLAVKKGQGLSITVRCSGSESEITEGHRMGRNLYIGCRIDGGQAEKFV